MKCADCALPILVLPVKLPPIALNCPLGIRAIKLKVIRVEESKHVPVGRGAANTVEHTLEVDRHASPTGNVQPGCQSEVAGWDVDLASRLTRVPRLRKRPPIVKRLGRLPAILEDVTNFLGCLLLTCCRGANATGELGNHSRGCPKKGYETGQLHLDEEIPVCPIISPDRGIEDEAKEKKILIKVEFVPRVCPISSFNQNMSSISRVVGVVD